VKKYGLMQSYTPDEILPILSAEERRDWQSAAEMARGIINRDESEFYSQPYANWVKSVALLHLSEAVFQSSGDKRQAVEYAEMSAKRGNLQAVDYVVGVAYAKLQKSPDFQDTEVDVVELQGYLRIGAELGDSRSAMMLGSDLWPNPLGSRERIYWTLIGVGGATDLTQEQRQIAMESLVGVVGEEEVEQAIEEFSPLGGARRSNVASLPGQDILTTIFVDANLRGQYGMTYGLMPRPEGERRTPDILEIFKLQEAYADVIGKIGAYLLVVESSRLDDAAILNVTRELVVESLGPGDYVFVRCGTLTHMAIVYSIDENTSRINFADGLFQYWQPSHNSCVTDFHLTPYRHGGYLASVALRDVTPLIQAVITFRDRAGASISQ
jgi:hypothetical protein